VPRRVLGESLAWQTLAPLVPAVLVALTVGAGIVRTLIAGIAGEGTSSCIGGPGDCGPGSPLWTTTPDAMPPVPVPVGDLATLGGTVLVAMILVVGVGYLFLKMSTDIEELRVG
jgi:hypothetical protein